MLGGRFFSRVLLRFDEFRGVWGTSWGTKTKRGFHFQQWAWVDSNYRPHAYQAPQRESESRQDAGKPRWIRRFAAFVILRCRDLPGSIDRTIDRTISGIERLPPKPDEQIPIFTVFEVE